MAYLEGKELYQAYTDATKEANIWREDYPEFERLAENGLIEDDDDTLPLVNDGSLAAALYKLPKRVVSNKLTGKARVLDKDDQWLSELATLRWKKHIVPNAISQAPFHRKWKDAVRKSAIYGGQPIVNLFMERGDYTGSDFIIPLATDVKLEAGKVSDYDSDVIFWDVYYSRLQVESMLEEAEEETTGKETDGDTDVKDDDKSGGKPEATAQKNISSKTSTTDDDDKDGDYNIWDTEALQAVLDADEEVSRPGNEEAAARQNKGAKKTGIHFYIAFQRGVNAPFMMYHPGTEQIVRKWSNPDPTGDIPVHYLYCYQDFINPYGTGIVKLAGGTQNVLDYMRKADVLATQLGLRPPKLIMGDENQVDFDSLTYTEDADWIVGNAKVERMEMATGVYNDLPNRINMYKQSLNNLIPMGDTSIGSSAGDPLASKTPAGVRQQAANLSIDDEDFKDNLYATFAAVAKSMINTDFANMEGEDLMRLDDDERELLQNAGIEFPTNDNGEATNQLEIQWDKARATFDFEVDPASGDMTPDAEQMVNLQAALADMTPQKIYYLSQAGWKFNMGEAVYAQYSKMNLDNLSDIMTKMTDEEKAEALKQPFPIVDPPRITLNSKDMSSEQLSSALMQGGVQNQPGIPAALQAEQGQAQQPAAPKGPSPEELQLKQGDLAIKQQLADQKGAELTLKAHQQGHQQSMDKLNHVQSANSAEHAALNPAPGKPDMNGKMPKQPAPSAPEAAMIPDSHPDPLGLQGDSQQNSQPAQLPDMTQNPSPEQVKANIEAVMEQYNVDQGTAAAMLEAERQGYSIEEVLKTFVPDYQGAQA